MVSSPCYNCKDRDDLGLCHDTCDKYWDFKEQLEKIRNVRNSKKLYDDYSHISIRRSKGKK